MFFGTFEHRLNSKNQVTVPASFRGAIDESKEGKGFFLFVGESDCLYLYTPKGMKDVVEDARARLGPADRNFLRNLYGDIVQVECDGQGRILLPARMKTAAGIKQDVVFVGANQRVDIWAPEKWQAFRKETAGAYQAKLNAVAGELFGL